MSAESNPFEAKTKTVPRETKTVEQPLISEPVTLQVDVASFVEQEHEDE